MNRSPTKGIIIYPNKTVIDAEFSDLTDYQGAVKGRIEAVRLSDGTTMYVNEEFLLGQFGPEDYNSVATDVAGMGGRVDLMLSGILGPVAVVGPVDDEGYDTDITDKARRWIKKVWREA